MTKQDADFQMFAEYYKIYQDFYIPEDDDAYWEDLVSTAQAFHNKYKSKFAKDLIMAYLDSRERLYKLKNA